MIYPVLAWIEGSTLGQLVRSAGVWSYGVLNLAHIVGVATFFGSVLVLDLRLLGFWRRIPLSTIAIPTVPLSRAGFGLAALAGVCILATNATDYSGNPFFTAKFVLIAIGLVNAAVIERLPPWRERHHRAPSAQEESRLAIVGGVSLISWIGTITAGRLVGYW